MPANLYPYVTGDPVLRSCRHRVHQGDRRVAAPSMCQQHPRTCLTCCSSRLKRDCGLPIRQKLAAISVEDFNEAYINTPSPTSWEERQADKARLNRELGFPDYTEAQLAEDAKWRTE